MNKGTSREDAYFELAFSPGLSLVSIGRRFVTEFYNEVLGDPEVTSRIAVATHELLENGARYALDGQTSVRIGVRKVFRHFEITITTTNRATPQNIDVVRRAVDELNAASSPQQHYQVLMRRTMKRTDGSGLGLGRVAAESDMRLSCEVEGDLIRLRANAHFDTRLDGQTDKDNREET
jgi:anti-sigma regulatory factor (Ser/Thr protein kinase)